MRELAPAWIAQLELASPIGDLAAPPRASGAPYPRAHVLVRAHGTPIGFVSLPLDDEGRCTAADAAARVEAELGPRIAEHLRRDGLPGQPLGTAGLTATADPACARPGPYPDRAQGDVSVVLCTRDRPEPLRRAIDSVLASDRGDVEVIVVDNAPATPAAREVVDGIADPRVRYVLEPVAGLSRARNTGARHARGALLAFTDDDVRVDPGWVRALVNGFTRAPHVGCATGPVLAAELETTAQAYLEARLSWSAFDGPHLFDDGANRPDDPMFPFSAGRLGTGANFAVDRATWTALGGLDELLGAGTPTMGGEDLDLFLRVILSGRALATEPRAILWHSHYPGLDALQRQQRSYGVGLAAYASKHLLDRRTGPAIARRVPTAVWRMARDTRRAQEEAAVEEEIPGFEPRWMLVGAQRYVRLRLRAHRETTAAP